MYVSQISVSYTGGPSREKELLLISKWEIFIIFLHQTHD